MVPQFTHKEFELQLHNMHYQATLPLIINCVKCFVSHNNSYISTYLITFACCVGGLSVS